MKDKLDYNSICELVREPTESLLAAARLLDRRSAVVYEAGRYDGNKGVVYEAKKGVVYEVR